VIRQASEPPVRPRLVAIVGPTATGKSALGIALARSAGGEIVACDSTAVYRGFDIGTDKVPAADQQGIPHHLVDVADPLEDYSAARYAREASAVVRGITARGSLPILVGGTGLYYRALVRGLFRGPGRDTGLRARLERVAATAGAERLHRWLARVDPASADRIQRRDLKRLVRALEVYLLTGRPLTAHFARHRVGARRSATRRPSRCWLPPAEIAERVRRRVDEQFARGLLDEIRGLLARGVPPTARPFGGLVYRQALEHLQGVRDEPATRALIAQENQRYARRQLIWFRKEPNLVWFSGPGEASGVLAAVDRALAPVLTPFR
jgi:tRNA dimethylallyltransferase